MNQKREIFYFRQPEFCVVSGFHSGIIFFFPRLGCPPGCCFRSARSNKLIMLITRNVLVEFIGRRESFYLPSTHHRVQRCVFIFDQETKRPHLVTPVLTSCYRRRRRRKRRWYAATTHSICSTIFSAFVLPFIIHSCLLCAWLCRRLSIVLVVLFIHDIHSIHILNVCYGGRAYAAETQENVEREPNEFS